MIDHDLPNKSPEPTAVGACSSAVAVHVASRRWLTFIVEHSPTGKDRASKKHE